MKVINKKKQSKINFNFKKPYNFIDNEVAILRKMVTICINFSNFL